MASRPGRIIDMRNSSLITLAGIVAVSLLAGCGRGARFDVTPASFPECRGPNIVAHVSWDAQSVTTDPVRIYIYKVGNPKVLWYQGSPKGDKDTGKWIADGSTLVLETSNGRVLGRHTIETTPCNDVKK